MAQRIAVIDDDGAIRDLLAEALADEGYEPLVFTDGAAALPALGDQPPDALILDLRLPPPLDGWALLARLQADPLLRALPVLVCTGDERAVRDQAAVLDRPNCAVLIKPFDLDDLFALLVRLGVAP
jgi:two-component system response regulator ChvI